MKRLLSFLIIVHAFNLQAQVVGGERTFEFLRLSQSPHITALGGLSAINTANDVMMTTANTALLRPEFHTSMGLNYNFYYAKTKVSNFVYAHHIPKLNTTFALGVQYLDYGSFTMTDDLGNIYGQNKAADYSINFSASRKYLERWRYGATLKYAKSHLFDQKSAALLFDLGVAYTDTTNKWYVGAVVKNAGVQVTKYNANDGSQPMPLDLQIGITKKFKKAPFSFGILAHHLYQWDVRYDNPADVVNNQLLFTDTTTTTKQKTYFADKLFRHFVFSVEANLGKRIEISAGYNHLRRSELSITDKKGMSGFSFGAGLYLNKFVLHFAQSYYHVAGPMTEMGLQIKLNQLFGFGTGGQKINWSDKFANSF
jgi:hypothetical protein